MQLLLELRDKQFPDQSDRYEFREAARMVALDEEGRLPVLFVSKHNYHKLPGGGIDEGETKEEALVRELIEETNCTVEIEAEVGKIIEFRSAESFKWIKDLEQHSYCYLGRVIEKHGEPEFTEGERAEGFQLLWVTLDEAINILEADVPDNMEGAFIQKRDLVLLKEAKKLLNH